MILSILIPSLVSRKQHLDLLCSYISNQIHQYMVDKKIDVNVEILCQIDNGEATIGQKRNDLLNNAKGEYLCFIDDDDRISSNYISLVLEAIKNNPNIDCIGFIQDYLVDGKEQIGGSKVCISLKYNQWDLNVDGYLAVRTPHHLTPIKRQICIDAGGYKNLDKAEDLDFSNRVYPLLKNEYFINETLYYYQKKTENEHQKF